MTFDKILDNNTLWAVRYEGATDNALQTSSAIRLSMLMDLWISCLNCNKEKEAI